MLYLFVRVKRHVELPRRGNVALDLLNDVLGHQALGGLLLRELDFADQHVTFCEAYRVLIHTAQKILILNCSADRALPVVKPPVVVLFERQRDDGERSLPHVADKDPLGHFRSAKCLGIVASDLLGRFSSVAEFDQVDARALQRPVNHLLQCVPNRDVLV